MLSEDQTRFEQNALRERRDVMALTFQNVDSAAQALRKLKPKNIIVLLIQPCHRTQKPFEFVASHFPEVVEYGDYPLYSGRRSDLRKLLSTRTFMAILLAMPKSDCEATYFGAYTGLVATIRARYQRTEEYISSRAYRTRRRRLQQIAFASQLGY